MRRITRVREGSPRRGAPVAARRAGLAIACLLAASPALGRVLIEPEGPRDAQRAVRRAPVVETDSLEVIASAIGAALVEAGFGAGSFEIAREAGDVRVDLGGIEPTRLTDWVWDPSGDTAASAPPRLAGKWNPSARAGALEAWLREEQDEGRPFASVRILEAEGDGAALRVRARYLRGPAVALRAVHFEGRGSTRPGYLLRASGLKPGAPLRPSDADLGRDRLIATGLFERVDGPYLRPSLTRSADLVYHLVPGRQNQVEGAIGYDGRRRTLSGVVRVELANLFGSGRRFLGAWESQGADRSRLEIAYREPYLAGWPVALTASLMQELEDTTWTADQAQAILDADLGGGIGVHGGFSYRRTVESGVGGFSARNFETILGGSLEDRADRGLRGGRIEATLRRGRVRRSPSYGPGEGLTTRIDVLADRGFPIRRRGHLRLEVQGIWIEAPDSLPRLDAASLGGGSSLRGSPEGAFRTLRSGLARAEIGVRSDEDGGRAYLFVDAAAFRPWPRGATERRTSYGAGARVRGAGGYLRLDYGVPWREPPLSGRIHFRLETRF